MYILYLDESGNPGEPSDRHFVLGGLACFERLPYHLTGQVDDLQRRILPRTEPVPFHAVDIRTGRGGFWRAIDETTRLALLDGLLDLIAQSDFPGVILFAAAVQKSDRLHGEALVKRAAMEVCRRFDLLLMRRHQAFGDTQRGLIVFANSGFRERSRLWVEEFRSLGTEWGVLRNLADIPLFASPKETRLLQLADLVSHAVYQAYERGNSLANTGVARARVVVCDTA